MRHDARARESRLRRGVLAFASLIHAPRPGQLPGTRRICFAVGFAVWRSRPPAPPAKSASAVPTKTDTPAIAPATPAAPPPVATPSAAAPSATPARRRAPAPATEAAAAEPAAAPAAATGTLHIDSDVAGAQVFIDRRFIGVVPVTEPDVSAGNHRINVVATGYESLAENVDVAPGPRDLHFNFKEIRLDASIAVVHKHRMGSCKGRLIATPQGLRYDTTDKDDAFSAPLERFRDLRRGLSREGASREAKEGQALRVHRSRRQRRSAVRVSARRRQGPPAPQGRH